MGQIQSVYGLVWHIKNLFALSDADRQFIETFSPTIFHNDRECYLWAFDTKLPSGAWLENIRFSNDLKTATAYIAA